jgi:hypothetical protein
MSCGNCNGGCGAQTRTDPPIAESFRERYNARLSVCLGDGTDICPSLRKWIPIPKAEQCGICGCFVRAKAALPKESCPAGFW